MGDLAASPRINQKNNALEGLRGIAAIMVVLSHCVFTFFPYLQNCNVELIRQSWETIAIQFPRTVFNGTFAVCIFFVMSGFVLAKAFFHDRPYALEQGAVKRYIRLMLPVAASIFICCAMMSAGLLKVTVTDLSGFVSAFYQGVPNYAEASKDALWRALLNGGQTYNYVLWSMRIEFLGSLLLFAFLALFGRARYGWVYAVAIVWAIATVDPLNAPVYGLFFVGAYLNKAGNFGRNKLTHAAAVIVALYLGGSQSCTPAYGFLIRMIHAFPINVPPDIWGYTPIGIGATLLVWVAVDHNLLSRVLSAKPFLWLGHHSFAIYLLHSFFIPFVGLHIYAATEGKNFALRALLSTLGVIISSSLAAMVFTRLVDEPAVRLANRFAQFSFRRLRAVPAQDVDNFVRNSGR